MARPRRQENEPQLPPEPCRHCRKPCAALACSKACYAALQAAEPIESRVRFLESFLDGFPSALGRKLALEELATLRAGRSVA
jgi:hypothetical protein